MSQNNEHAGDDEQLFSQELADWALFALDAAVEFFTDGDSTPFLLFMDQDEKKNLINLEMTEETSIEAVLDGAREQLIPAFSNAEFYALVWDAALNIEGEDHNGILAECGQQGEPNAWLFTQLYEGDVAEDTFDAKDDPIVISQMPSALGERE